MSDPLSVFRPDEPPGRAGPLTVRDVIAQYLEALGLRVQLGDFSAAALSDLRRDLLEGRQTALPDGTHAKALAELLGDTAAQDLRNQDLTRWLLANPQWQSLHTQKRNLGAAIAAFAWAAGEGELLPASPLRSRHPLLRREAPSRREADPREYIALMRGGSRPLRRALYFLWNTGCRPAEMRDVTWPEVDLDAGLIVLGHHKTAKKTGKPRLIGLSPRVVRFLRALKKQAPPWPENVFLNCYQGPWDRHTFARHLRRWAERLGLDEGLEDRVSAYCLRHSYITQADEGGVDVKAIADAAGHTNTRMVEKVYSKAARKGAHVRKVAVEIARRRREARKADRLDFPGGGGA